MGGTGVSAGVINWWAGRVRDSRGAPLSGDGQVTRRQVTVGAVLAVLVLLVAGVFAVPSWRCELTGCAKDSGGSGSPERPDDRTVSPQEAATRGGYVALGDSYSAGVGVQTGSDDKSEADEGEGGERDKSQADGDGDDGKAGAEAKRTDGVCLRHSAAYYHDVVRTFRFARGSAFWACSGATTAEVLDGRYGREPQTDRVDADTSLVTISIGGNDAGFTKVLTRCLAEVLLGDCRGQDDQVAERLDTLTRTLPRVLTDLTSRAPSARVLVVGYPRMFAAEPQRGEATIGKDDQRWLNERTRELDDIIARSARAADRGLVEAGKRGSVEYVEAYDAFDGHETGTADPYVNGLKLDLRALSAETRSFHPTEGGHRALGELVERQIRKGPGRPLAARAADLAPPTTRE